MTGKRKKDTETGILWDEGPVRPPLQNSRQRFVILSTIIFFGFFVICIRLFDLMVLDHEKLSNRASQQYSRQKTINSYRGMIWDRNMKEFAANIEMDSLYTVPSKIEDTRGLSKKLAPLLKVSSKSLNMNLLKKKDKDFIWLSRKMDGRTSEAISALRDESGYKELRFMTEAKRYYPKGSAASHVIGFTNIDNKGISGLELMYDKYLEGRSEKFRVDTDARGSHISGDIKEGSPGNNLVLTIDEGIQYIVENELSKAVAKWEAKAAVAVMMDPHTGEILAIANRPTYDPNNAGKSKAYARRNRAVTDLFEPGSTIKTVLASAALESNTVHEGDMFDVSDGYIIVGGKAIKDVHKSGVLSFQEVIQKSSNVGSVQVGLGLGPEKYYEYIKKFGFGEKTGIDLPGEVRGILRGTERWSGTSLAALSIGQEIGVTPMQVLSAYSVVANGGILMRPYIVSDIISPAGEVIQRRTPEAVRRVISPETAAKVRNILKTVVEEGGTATQAYMKGNMVAGKTGTAQIFDNKKGRYSKNRYVGSFAGFVPADNPRIALIVVLYEPKGMAYGGVVAAPVFKNIIERTFAYLDVPMEHDENRVYLVSKSR